MRHQSVQSEFGEEQLRSLGRRLRELREARSWSLRRLAGESRVSVAAVQKIESGESNPSLLTILSLAEALGEPVDRLVAASRANASASTVAHAVLPEISSQLDTFAASPRLGARLVTIAPRRTLVTQFVEQPRLFFVLDGSVRFSFSDGTSDTLHAGDSLHVAAGQTIRCANPLQRRSRMLLVADQRNQPQRNPEYA